MLYFYNKLCINAIMNERAHDMLYRNVTWIKYTVIDEPTEML